MDVVDAGLVWIWRQKKRLVSSVLVFSRIRTSLLSQGDRATIRECLRALPNGEKVRSSLLKKVYYVRQSSRKCLAFYIVGEKPCIFKPHSLSQLEFDLPLQSAAKFRLRKSLNSVHRY
ncbi:unnamed protein product [Gongylonema pulchrum]|uniref:Ribosomal protein S10 n=1 Tax=Gongylonema pulchrum TaxID=637853 RepID=A0A183DJP3_9BILA|nr:unnamed protein product [Gongylonema pulchrum]